MSCCTRVWLKIILLCSLEIIIIFISLIGIFSLFIGFSNIDKILITILFIAAFFLWFPIGTLDVFLKYKYHIAFRHLAYTITKCLPDLISLEDYRRYFEDNEVCIRYTPTLSRKKIIDELMDFYKLDIDDYNSLINISEFELIVIHKTHVVLLDLYKKGVNIAKLDPKYLKIHDCLDDIDQKLLFKIIGKDKVLEAFRRQTKNPQFE